jgi:hypothetical protein
MGYRVIQWATGTMGKSCLRAVIDHPDLELVGLWVHSDAKAGLDAGQIARRGPTGVIATRQMDEILALKADVVIHAPRLHPPYTAHDEEICRLLASGKNVISINGHSYPNYWGAGYARSFENACRQGASTLFGTGLNPGFIAEKIAVAASGLCLDLDRMEIREVVRCDQIQSSAYVFDILGFGTPCAAVDPNDPSWVPAALLNGLYSEVVAFVALRLGLDLEQVETDHVLHPAIRDIETAAGGIRQGTTALTHWRWHGIVGGRRRLTLSIFWTMDPGLLEDPAAPLWEVRIAGRPGVRLTIDLAHCQPYPARGAPEVLALAAAVVNSIPAVCSAAPGILTVPGFAPFRTRYAGAS